MHTHMATCNTALLLSLGLLLLPLKQMPSSAPLHMHKHCQQHVHDLPAGRRPLAPFATPCPSLSLAPMLCCLLRGVQIRAHAYSIQRAAADMAPAKVIGDVEPVCAAEGECARCSQVRQAVVDMYRALRRNLCCPTPPCPVPHQTR